MSVRAIHADALARLSDQGLHLAALYELDLDSGNLRMWSGVGPLFIGAEQYEGVGDFLSASAVEETQELRAVGLTVRLSGIPDDHVLQALTESVTNRFARIKLGILSDQGELQGEPVMLFSGRADIPRLVDDGTSSTYMLSIESRLIDLQRPSMSRLTNADQQRRHPGDRGLEHIPALQDHEIVWST